MTLRQLKLFLITIGGLLAPIAAEAQQLQASLSHFSTDNGLASNAIANMVQDDYGYLWLATWNGLSRFDGYQFYNYQTGAGSRIPHLHNRVVSLAVDNQQNIWMRMYDNRVFVVKRSIDQIINPFEGISGHEEFRTFYPITVTSAGDVLVNIEGTGLYKMRIERDGVRSQLITTGGLAVTSMAEGYQNDIWLGTNQGVHRMDISNQTIERKGLFLDEHVTCLFSNGYNIFAGTESGKIMSFSYGQEPRLIRSGGQAINALFVDSHGLIWFSDKNPGAMRLNPETGDEKRFTQRITVPDYDGKGGVFSETNGIVWVRMNHGGYGYYNRQTDEVEYFHNDPSNPWNLLNSVNAALELNEGVIWESTARRGLEKLEILKNTISRTQLVPEAGATGENDIRALCYDHKRKLLLIGNKGSKLFLVRPDSTRTVLTKDATGRPLGRIYGISLDAKGNYLLCCKDDGLYRIAPQASGTYEIKNYRHNDQSEWSLSSDKAYYAVEDKEGNIWIATYGGGVNLMTQNKNGQTVFLHSKNAMKNYPYNSHMFVRTVAVDKEGNVWAGTTDGILIMSYKNRKLKISELESSEEDPSGILQSGDVVCLALDRNGSMWVGTNGGGLAHTIGKDSKGRWLFENFGAKDGLPSEEIHSITFDASGNVWFATDHVLCSFDTGKRIFTTFSSLDGVDDTMCSEGAAITLPGGNIIFGTINGYYTVDRQKLVNTTGNMLKLRITDFFLNDELQSPRLNSTYDYYVPDSRSVKLPGHNAVIGFRFAALNYQLQHRVHYQYILDGYDRTWQNADKMRTANYANLPTGTYRFRVKAFLLESPEKFDMKTIEVVVPPYFLLSRSAIWLYMILAVALGIWLMFWRQGKLEKAEKMRQLKDGPRTVNYQADADQDFMQQLNDYIDVHYADPMLTTDEMAEAAGMTTEEFTQQVKKLTKQTPKELVSDYRLKKALDMLENTDDSIAQIAFNCGFSDPQNFNRHFKSKTGTMPSKYRDQHRQQAAQDEPTDEYELIE